MPKILLVEDDLPLMRLYSNILTDAGYEVTAVESGAMAIESIDRDRPEVMILDLNLPDQPGTTILEYVAARQDLPKLQVIVMTGFARYKKNTLPIEVVDVLQKPVIPAMLLRVTREAIASNVKL